jgi:hypothetical protein
VQQVPLSAKRYTRVYFDLETPGLGTWLFVMFLFALPYSPFPQTLMCDQIQFFLYYLYL